MTSRAWLDPRDPATFTADLHRETDRSLARDPTRWPGRTLDHLGWQRRRWQEPGTEPRSLRPGHRPTAPG